VAGLLEPLLFLLGFLSRLSQAGGGAAGHLCPLAFDIGGPQRRADCRALVSRAGDYERRRGLALHLPVFVKENTIAANGIISRSVATVPKLFRPISQL